MEKQKTINNLFLCLIFVALSLCGCAVTDSTGNRTVIEEPVPAGWVGIDIAYEFKLPYPSHAVVSVGDGTPASRAGLVVGDEIHFVGSKNAGYFSTPEIARLLRESESDVEIKVKRKGSADLLSFHLTKSDPASERKAEPTKMPAGTNSDRNPEKPEFKAMPPSVQPMVQAEKTIIDPQTKGSYPYLTEWGFKSEFTDKGVVIQQITPGSPAEKGGLSPGDLVTALDGMAVKDIWDFLLPPYVPVKFLILRSGSQKELTIVPLGILKLEVTELDKSFAIPGVPENKIPDSISPIDALDYMNVLDRVVLDPNTGQVAITGHYDRAFETGNIPYLDLLKTAMANPAPILNLELTPETKEQIAAAQNKIDSNLKIMVDAVRGHPDFVRERQLMIRELAKLYGLAPGEYADWYNYVKLYKNKERVPPIKIQEVQYKVFTNLGFTEVAQALRVLYENKADAASKALEVLGVQNAVSAGIENSDAITAEAYLALPLSARITSPKELQPLRKWYETQTISLDNLIQNVQGMLMPYLSKNGSPDSNLMINAFTRIFMSSEAVQVLEELPTPYAAIAPIDLDGGSQLARIMYEADYGLKSMSIRPELFREIPGSLSRMEYQNSHGLLISGKTIDYRQYLEPMTIGMEVSPDSRVIHFTASRMRYHFVDHSEYWQRPPNKELERGFAAWCNQFMDHYDAYSMRIPAFHKIREAAKIIALAKWAIAEKIPIDMSSVIQEKWSPPDKVPAHWVLSQGINSDNKTMGTVRAVEGGVSFKTRGSWTQIVPSTATTTEASSHLVMSSHIGRMAVEAAGSGDLEKARYLAELSAQAMTGLVSRENLARQNIVLPQSSPIPVTPENIHLQKEAIKATSRQIDSMIGNREPDEQAIESLNKIAQEYRGIQDSTISAQNTKAWKPCGDPLVMDKKTVLSPEQSKFLNSRLAETRQRLKHINTALKKLIKLNEGQRHEIEKTIAEISTAYDESVERAWSVVFDLMISLPADKFMDNYGVAKSKLERAIKLRTQALDSSLDSGVRKTIESEIRRIQAGKDHLANIYEGAYRMLDIFKGTNYAYDIDRWNSESRDDYQKAQDGAIMIGKLLLDFPKVAEYLEGKKFFVNNKFYQVAAMGRMAYYGTGFFLDILAQQAIWEPMTAGLHKDLENNIRQMEELRSKAAVLYTEIDCIEQSLR